MLRWVRRLLAAVLLLPAMLAAGTPVIAIIMDDMGNQLPDGQRAVALPGAMTYAFLPHTPYAGRLAELAHAQDKEVMLHLPMDANKGNPLGPGGLTQQMTSIQVKSTLAESLQAVPHAVGVNNHMGSLLTQDQEAMGRLMQGLQEHGNLYFIDSRTSVMTVAERIAREHGLPANSRDVFLDHVREPEAIRAEFQRLIRIALNHGRAVAIGHPHPETLQVLTEELARLDEYGVRLVFVSQLINHPPLPSLAPLLAKPVMTGTPLAPRLGAKLEGEAKEADL
jgi:polysaccharide deacetylase 2 family uncharacterized protein YibQ